jgi:hapalindole H/12-epi-hapalindole U/12-epi-fischerindole U synthase
MLVRLKRFILMFAICGVILPTAGRAAPIAIVNAGFEDTSGQAVFNEFTFGTPTGWTQHDPNGIIVGTGNGPDVFLGTLQPNGTDFFNTTAPEGNKVAIMFNRDGSTGAGEYGLTQTLSATLQGNMRYQLSVEVGNIASGNAQNAEFFNLDGFPGYRIELLAGGVVIGQDNNTLAGVISEGEFLTSMFTVDVGAAHAQLGQSLGIRLVNLNVVDGAFPTADLEVDFDDVQLDATAISAPGSLALFSLMFGVLVARRRRQ